MRVSAVFLAVWHNFGAGTTLVLVVMGLEYLYGFLRVESLDSPQQWPAQVGSLCSVVSDCRGGGYCLKFPVLLVVPFLFLWVMGVRFCGSFSFVLFLSVLADTLADYLASNLRLEGKEENSDTSTCHSWDLKVLANNSSECLLLCFKYVQAL